MTPLSTPPLGFMTRSSHRFCQLRLCSGRGLGPLGSSCKSPGRLGAGGVCPAWLRPPTQTGGHLLSLSPLGQVSGAWARRSGVHVETGLGAPPPPPRVHPWPPVVTGPVLSCLLQLDQPQPSGFEGASRPSGPRCSVSKPRGWRGPGGLRARAGEAWPGRRGAAASQGEAGTCGGLMLLVQSLPRILEDSVSHTGRARVCKGGAYPK